MSKWRRFLITRILSFFIISTIAAANFIPQALAQAEQAAQAVIVEIKGKAYFRSDPKNEWQEAKVGQKIAAKEELKTPSLSSCSLAFDDDKENIVTVKESTTIKVESVAPGHVFLPEGRIFTLINDLPDNQKFELRT